MKKKNNEWCLVGDEIDDGIKRNYCRVNVLISSGLRLDFDLKLADANHNAIC